MATFTSTLPDDLLAKLSEYSKKLGMPKNKLIETALSIYLDHLKRAEYIKSFRNTQDDAEMTLLAEEGITEYLKQLEDETR